MLQAIIIEPAMRKKHFYRFVHVYQRSYDKGIIFYDDLDRLLFYTVISRVATTIDVKILALCLMPDHIHLLVNFNSEKEVIRFVQGYSSLFAKEYNSSIGRHGPLFEPCFGRAEKISDKKIRTCLSYIYNNPVEKKLCEKVELSIWNFLAYANSPHPFSEQLVIRRASWNMRKNLKTCQGIAASNRHLSITLMKKMFETIGPKEKNQMRDFIIGLYNVIYHKEAISFFGSFGSMVLASNSNTGSEYDIKEHFFKGCDADFNVLTETLMSYSLFERPGEVITMDTTKKMMLLSRLQRDTYISPSQICRFLHIAP